MQAFHINGIRVGDNNLENHKKGIYLYPTFLQHCMDYNLSEYDQHNLSTQSCLVCKPERFFNNLNLIVAVKNCFQALYSSSTCLCDPRIWEV